jgi:hypothetical protein
MKTTWKHMSAALLVFAGTAKAGAVTTDPVENPGVVKKVESNAPAVQARGKKVFVNLLNLDGEAVTVKVFDEENRLLYLKNFEENPVVEKAFNFEEAYEGTYSVIVKDGEATYTASVEVSR